MASKKNKNNPDNKSNGINGNSKDNIKQNKLISSEYCENNCEDIGECQKYKDYINRMVGRVCYGIRCNK